MLRLAHRLLARARQIGNESVETYFHDCHLIIADNVADYAEHQLGKDKSLEEMLVGCRCVPPFDKVFAEYVLPEKVYGIHPTQGEIQCSRSELNMLQGGLLLKRLVGGKRDETLREVAPTAPFDTADVKWLYTCAAFITSGDGQATALPVYILVMFDDSGVYLGSYKKGVTADLSELADAIRQRALLAFAFAHCKNVSKLDVTAEAGPTKKWCRRMRVPELKYHALQIDPNLSAKPRAASAPGGEDRSGKALHICRGHFRTYAEGGPGLFGSGRTGTFWVPSHTRGSSEHGTIAKDYTVGVPAA